MASQAQPHRRSLIGAKRTLMGVYPPTHPAERLRKRLKEDLASGKVRESDLRGGEVRRTHFAADATTGPTVALEVMYTHLTADMLDQTVRDLVLGPGSTHGNVPIDACAPNLRKLVIDGRLMMPAPTIRAESLTSLVVADPFLVGMRTTLLSLPNLRELRLLKIRFTASYLELACPQLHTAHVASETALSPTGGSRRVTGLDASNNLQHLVFENLFVDPWHLPVSLKLLSAHVIDFPSGDMRGFAHLVNLKDIYMKVDRGGCVYSVDVFHGFKQLESLFVVVCGSDGGSQRVRWLRDRPLCSEEEGDWLQSLSSVCASVDRWAGIDDWSSDAGTDNFCTP